MRRLLALSLILLFSLSAIAQDDFHKNEFGFRSDNDAYLAFGQDQYYTNGLFLTYRRATDQAKLKGNLSKLIWELEAGQKMYTPSSADVSFISEVDRPFAAYSYAGSSIHLLYNTERTLKISLQAGTIGPNAKGKETQEFLHNTFGFYEVTGWEWQVSNEFAVNSELEYHALLYRDAVKLTDFTLNSYARLGNTFSGAGAGILFRSGSLNPLFSSTSTNSVISNNSEEKNLHKAEMFFYARPMLNLIFYDASIQGPMFRDDKGLVTYPKKPFVFSQQLGFAYAGPRWTIDFNVNFKSKEVKSTAKGHQYGSVSVYRRF